MRLIVNCPNPNDATEGLACILRTIEGGWTICAFGCGPGAWLVRKTKTGYSAVREATS